MCDFSRFYTLLCMSFVCSYLCPFLFFSFFRLFLGDIYTLSHQLYSILGVISRAFPTLRNDALGLVLLLMSNVGVKVLLANVVLDHGGAHGVL